MGRERGAKEALNVTCDGNGSASVDATNKPRLILKKKNFMRIRVQTIIIIGKYLNVICLLVKLNFDSKH